MNDAGANSLGRSGSRTNVRQVEGRPRVYAIADEDLDREDGEKTSAVHFVRFERPQAAREAVRADVGVKLGLRPHEPYGARFDRVLASLAGDLWYPPSCGEHGATERASSPHRKSRRPS